MKERLKFIRRSVALTLILVLCLAAAPAALAESFAAYVSASSASVWSDAKQSKRVGSLEQYSVVTVVKWQGDVAAVLYYGNPGYMRVRDLHRVDDGCPEAAVAEKTKVYLEPKTSSPSLSVSKGTKVRLVKAFDSGWAMIEKDGVGAYIQVSALAYSSETPVLTATPAPTATPSTENAISGTVTADKVKVYKEADTSSKYLGTLGKGTQVNVLKYNGSWAYIELNGNYGYCAVSALTRTDELNKTTPTPTAAPTATPSIENAVPGTVTADKVKVYASASASSKYLGTIGRGTQVNVLKWSGGWAYIELNGNYGYCALSALTRTDELNTPTPSIENAVAGTVTADKVKVYAQASASSKYLGTLGRGTQVNVLKWSGGWAYIELNGNYGYCKLSALTPTSNLATPAPTATPNPADIVPAVVTASKVKVYASANASSKYLGTLGKGTQVNVIAWKNGWAYIELNGNYGYCALSALTRTDAMPTPTPVPDETGSIAAVVTADKADVYSGMDGSIKLLGTLKKGTQVTVLQYWSAKDAAYIELDGSRGYCKLSALTRADALATPKPDGSGDIPAVVMADSVKVYSGIGDTAQYLGTLSKGALVTVKQYWSSLDVALIQMNSNTGYCKLSALTTASLSSGSKGELVTRVQQQLYSLGYFIKTSSVDGDFGSTTVKAVKLFQKANGLSETGNVDASTLSRMFGGSAVRLPSGTAAADYVAAPNVVPGNQQNNSTTISSTLASGQSTYSSGMSKAQKLEYVIYVAQNQLGKPYVYAANGPSSYDCTGFTKYCFRQIGVNLQRTALNQGYDETYTKISSISDLRRGDLVYLNTVADADLSDHAGIYLGAGYFIHASSGQHKVVISTLASGYYNRVFSWGRRVFD